MERGKRGGRFAVLGCVALLVLSDFTAAMLHALWRRSSWAAVALMTVWLPLAVLGVLDMRQRRLHLPPRPSGWQRAAWASAVLWPFTLFGALLWAPS